MKGLNQETNKQLSKEQIVENVIRYGDYREEGKGGNEGKSLVMNPDEQPGLIAHMLDNNLTWDDLNTETQQSLGGKLRFATNVYTAVNKGGASQGVRDELADQLNIHNQRETQPSFRMMYGLKNTLSEMKSGALNLFGDHQGAKEDAQQSYIDSQVRSRAYEAYTGGTDMLTPAGEEIPATAMGAMLPVSKLPKLGAFFTDLAAQAVASGAEYLGASDHDPQATSKAGTDIVANIAGQLVGSWANKLVPGNAFTTTEVEGLTAQTKELADELGIKLFSVDGTLNKAGIKQFKQRIASLTPSEQYLLGNETSDGIAKFVDAYGTLADNLVKGSADAATVGTKAGDDLAAKRQAMQQYFKHNYKMSDELMGEMEIKLPSEKTFLDITASLKDTRVDVREDIAAFTEKLRMDHGDNITPKELVDLIKIYGSKARDEASKQGGATAAGSYNQIVSLLKGKLDEVAPNQALKDANAMYAEDVSTFGYGNLGKGAAEDNLVPKFIKQLESDPQKALKLINTPKKAKLIRDNVSEDTFAMIGKNKLEEVVTASTTNGATDLLKVGQKINGMSDEMLEALYGESASKIRQVANLAELLGKRQSSAKSIEDKNIAQLFVDKNLRGSLGSWLPMRMAFDAAVEGSKKKTLKEMLREVIDVDGMLLKQEPGKGLVEVPSVQVGKQPAGASHVLPIIDEAN